MANKKIIDEFTDLPISRQRKYQLRNKALGLCILCQENAVPGMARCLKHSKNNLKYSRITRGCDEKYENTKLQRYIDGLKENKNDR